MLLHYSTPFLSKSVHVIPPPHFFYPKRKRQHIQIQLHYVRLCSYASRHSRDCPLHHRNSDSRVANLGEENSETSLGAKRLLHRGRTGRRALNCRDLSYAHQIFALAEVVGLIYVFTLIPPAQAEDSETRQQKEKMTHALILFLEVCHETSAPQGSLMKV